MIFQAIKRSGKIHGNSIGKTCIYYRNWNGVGHAAALTFVKKGAKSVGCNWEESPVQETVSLVRQSAGKIVSINPQDMGGRESAQDWADWALREYGEIDILSDGAAYNRAKAPSAET